MHICTFWYGRSLRYVDRVCLASMVKAGHRVKLFSYGEVDNLPAGVEPHDAAAILPIETFRRLDPNFPDIGDYVTIVQFSDLFRIMLMKHRQGVWLDTDVYLVKPFSPDPAKPYLARENRKRVGVSALYLPPDNPVVADFERYIHGTEVLPEWLGPVRGMFRPAWYRLIGKEVSPASIGITIFGNDGISRLAARHGFFDDAAPKESFYYWTGDDALRIFDPAYGLEPLDHPAFVGFHVHRKGPSELPPRQGSFFDWAVKRLSMAETR
ncbi:glycosyltransferase [Aquamicrobium sp. LC103]|uniref:glycosyltransferase n=1 Tax=Aquamicrobium sp. LC103 TaxID=1120658 RepID=UPI0010C9DB90|nr:glycosyltransferase [Aquamicrobium sp. LC103]TKT74251.1 hypothetical protein XW59_024905 [Aquamicrobium sp. LC103]